MEQTLISAALKDGIFAVLFVALFLYQLRESRRIQDDGKDRESRIQDEAAARELRINTEAREREDRLLKLAEGIAQQFETLAGQYETLRIDVNDIKSAIKREG
ncbi:BhlA/UviB family holin-like peptide [Paenibacillus polymyxa]|uniref:BhlA/UviB family holin-like peptide n=1 Tax=Paenibacillus TaxID=44249 RepID=UPI00142DDE23|nr:MULTISPECIES: BhlA/UviB family holin-like peptide [Paenibacillus]KAF6658853.1 hypothetical protein HFD99_01150 [Paenibacillus sp. EKM301P]UBS85382.1 hypothetical protein LAZ93_14535 [Paenibacillus polymyxa]WHX33897.1 BhlA/UviB family holin-like peptide [Paenibacillus polymyxa]